MHLLITLLYLVFVFSSIILIVVILLQEGRGGGFGTALGEGGQQTFGVGAKGINQFTGYAAVVFLGSAIAIHILTLKQGSASALPPPSGISAPAEGALPPVGEAPPPGDG